MVSLNVAHISEKLFKDMFLTDVSTYCEKQKIELFNSLLFKNIKKFR